MDAPITRAQLNEGFRIKKAYDDECMNIEIEKYVNETVKHIVHDLMYSMGFILEQKKKLVRDSMAIVSNNDSSIVECKTIVQHYTHYFHRYQTFRGSTNKRLGNSRLYCIPQLVLALQKKFPDSEIHVDHLNTYLTIDWS
jgi:hypothetical protein